MPVFWSYVGLVTEGGVVYAIRDPPGEYVEEQQRGTVQFVAAGSTLPITISSACELGAVEIEGPLRTGMPWRGWDFPSRPHCATCSSAVEMRLTIPVSG